MKQICGEMQRCLLISGKVKQWKVFFNLSTDITLLGNFVLLPSFKLLEIPTVQNNCSNLTQVAGAKHTQSCFLYHS